MFCSHKAVLSVEQNFPSSCLPLQPTEFLEILLQEDKPQEHFLSRLGVYSTKGKLVDITPSLPLVANLVWIQLNNCISQISSQP